MLQETINASLHIKSQWSYALKAQCIVEKGQKRRKDTCGSFFFARMRFSSRETSSVILRGPKVKVRDDNLLTGCRATNDRWRCALAPAAAGRSPRAAAAAARPSRKTGIRRPNVCWGLVIAAWKRVVRGEAFLGLMLFVVGGTDCVTMLGRICC